MCDQLGPGGVPKWSRSGRAASGFSGAISGAKMATVTNVVTKNAPRIATGLRISR